MPKLRLKPARRGLALACIVLASLVFTVRLVDLQVVSAAGHNADASGKRAVQTALPSLRGDIVDRAGAVLGTTDERYDVQLSPKNTRLNGGRFYRPVEQGGVATAPVTAQQAFAEIGEVTGQTPEEIQRIVDEALEENPDSDFAYVKRFVDLTTLNRLKELAIPWLTFESQHSRVYPNGAVGGTIIGFSGVDGRPQAGVELSQDACLAGMDGEERYERGADGVKLPGSVVVTQEAVDGGTVQLSLDRDLQWQVQQAIDGQVGAVAAEWGLITVMDVATGELVAVAEDGGVDPNDVGSSDPAKREARSFTSPYEPGSTFKALTAAAAIEAGTATPLTRQLTPSTWEPEPGVRFGDSFSHPAQPWTLTGIMVHSSNVGISMIGGSVSPERRHESLEAFGIGVPTAAGMPLEDSGLLFPAGEWDRQTSYNTMFGQGLSSTIVQTAGAYQAIANGGLRVPPSLVLRCTAADGTVTEPDHGEPVRAVSESTAASMMQVLENVVQESWITEHVAIPGYRVAGKTGTAEQSDGRGGYRSDFVHSFAGIFPADQPRYVVVASVAFPAAGDGSLASLRAFREAAESTIRTFHIPPSTGEYQPLPTSY